MTARAFGLFVVAWSGVARAAEVSLPEQTTVFEDDSLDSDEDLNDVVVRWSGQCDFAPDGDLVRLSWSLTAVAAGASVDSALLLTLPAGFPASDVTIDRGGVLEATAGAGGTVLTVWEDFRHDAFGGAPAGFVNTVPLAPIAPGIPVLVTVQPLVPANAGVACPTPGLSIQPASWPAVDLGSTIGANARPLAGSFDGTFQPAVEHTSVAEAYAPHFLAWVDDVFDGTCQAECEGPMWFEQPVGGLVIDRPDLVDEAPLADAESCGDIVENQAETSLDCGDPYGVCTPCDDCAALAFDGVNDYARMSAVTTGTALGAGVPWTVEGWFRVDALPSNTGDGTELAILVAPTCGYWGVYVQPDGRLYYGRWPNVCSGTTPVAVGEWHHFAATGQRAAGTAYELYLDGALDCAGTSTASEPAAMDSEWIQVGVRSDYCLSEGNTPNTARWWFAGALKGLRFSDTVRYSAPFTPPVDLTADAATRILWRFDEGSGVVLDDVAGDSHDAAILGATWQSDGPACPAVPE